MSGPRCVFLLALLIGQHCPLTSSTRPALVNRNRLHSKSHAVHMMAFFKSIGRISDTFYRGVDKHISDELLKEKIAVIKQHSGGGGMEAEEYFHFMSYVRDHAPQNLLVWGIGYDSVMLDKLNQGGKTVFLEMDVSWVDKTDAKDLNYFAYDAGLFGTSAATWKDFVQQPHSAHFPEIGGACWETVLVDSPTGYAPANVGRAVPIYTAKLNIDQCHKTERDHPDQPLAVFVHDCDREAENGLTSAFLGSPSTEVGPKKLRKWLAAPAKSS